MERKTKTSISIILPTYNEKELISHVIDNIIKTLTKNKILKYEILVVDDDSHDGTKEVVLSKIKKNNKIKLISRKNKKGLSSAIIEGFSKAKGNYLFVMDADGQHDEKTIPNLLRELKKNDLVIASRFVKGGSVTNWGKFRLFQSRIAALLSKPLLKKKIADPMSGFFCIKKSTFLKVKSRLSNRGYKILLDILFNLNNNETESSKTKIKIKEVPYKFKIRKKGKSKLNSKVVFDYLVMLTIFYFICLKRFFKFSLVGASGIFVNMFVLFVLTEKIGLFYLISSLISIETSIVTNFLLNDNWTWKGTKRHSLMSRFLRYNLTSIGGMMINLGVLFLLTQYFNLFYLISNLFGILLATIWNFNINHKWTFKNRY